MAEMFLRVKAGRKAIDISEITSAGGGRLRVTGARALRIISAETADIWWHLPARLKEENAWQATINVEVGQTRTNQKARRRWQIGDPGSVWKKHGPARLKARNPSARENQQAALLRDHPAGDDLAGRITVPEFSAGR